MRGAARGRHSQPLLLLSSTSSGGARSHSSPTNGASSLQALRSPTHSPVARSTGSRAAGSLPPASGPLHLPTISYSGAHTLTPARPASSSPSIVVASSMRPARPLPHPALHSGQKNGSDSGTAARASSSLEIVYMQFINGALCGSFLSGNSALAVRFSLCSSDFCAGRFAWVIGAARLGVQDVAVCEWIQRPAASDMQSTRWK